MIWLPGRQTSYGLFVCRASCVALRSAGDLGSLPPLTHLRQISPHQCLSEQRRHCVAIARYLLVLCVFHSTVVPVNDVPGKNSLSLAQKNTRRSGFCCFTNSRESLATLARHFFLGFEVGVHFRVKQRNRLYLVSRNDMSVLRK